MIRKIMRFFLASCLILSAFPSAASDTNGPHEIYGVYGTFNGALLFSTKSGNARSNLPACASTTSERWAIDASTPAGQAAAAVLLTAWTQHKRVWVTGKGVCTIWGDTETIEHFLVEDD